MFDRYGLSLWHCNSQNLRQKLLNILCYLFGGEMGRPVLERGMVRVKCSVGNVTPFPECIPKKK